jgi:hypothetical protein
MKVKTCFYPLNGQDLDAADEMPRIKKFEQTNN